MYNLHLAVVKAKSPKEACDYVENEISEYGDDNNWGTICGAVSETNEVFINDKDGCYPPEVNDTIESINAEVKGWFNLDDYASAVKEEIDSGGTDFAKWNRHGIWLLKMLAEELYEQSDISKDDFNVLKNSYYAYKYDRFGVTNMVNKEEEGQLYVVFIAMHS